MNTRTQHFTLHRRVHPPTKGVKTKLDRPGKTNQRTGFNQQASTSRLQRTGFIEQASTNRLQRTPGPQASDNKKTTSSQHPYARGGGGIKPWVFIPERSIKSKNASRAFPSQPGALTARRSGAPCMHAARRCIRIHAARRRVRAPQPFLHSPFPSQPSPDVGSPYMQRGTTPTYRAAQSGQLHSCSSARPTPPRPQQ